MTVFGIALKVDGECRVGDTWRGFDDECGQIGVCDTANLKSISNDIETHVVNQSCNTRVIMTRFKGRVTKPM